MIYTSGTTGSPKGVRTPERAFRTAISSAAELMGLDATTRTLCVSPFHFDGAYGMVFPTLVAGGSLVIPRREKMLFVKPFYTALLEEGITHTGFTPSYPPAPPFLALVDEPVLEHPADPGPRR